MDAAELALRAIGGFYAFAGIVAIRAGAMGELITKALIAIKGTATKEDRADRIRTKILAANSVMMGIGGVLLTALLDIALPVFVLSALLYTGYILIIAPRFLDPYDPPDPNGRRQSRNAMWVYLIATMFVCLGWWNGLLRPVLEESMPVLVLAGLASAGVTAYAIRSFAPWRGPGSPASTLSEEAYALDDDMPETEMPDRLVVTPSFDGALVDAETGETIGWLPKSLLPDEQADRMYAWQSFFQELADPDDPTRSKLKDASRQPEIEAAGRPVYEWLLSQLGPERVTYQPMAWPQKAYVHPRAVKIMPDYGSDPIWFMDSDEVGCIYPHALGISWSLAEDICEWGRDFEGAIDWNDPGGKPSWNDTQFATHSERGRKLAERLVDELARTGRADMPVWYHAYGDEPIRIA